MTAFAEHPTVKTVRARTAAGALPEVPRTIDAAWLRSLCLEAGADDVGFVAIDNADIAEQKSEI
ncbi:MAG TPA: 4Fe-4S ferredoxin, partial [Methylovirgula sp.]|nr:4Fe-4S ferredoxin [Methylovirgula sp.]